MLAVRLVADHVDLIDVHAEGVAARFRCGAEHTDTGAACDLPHDVAAVIVKLHCAGVASLLIAEAVAVDDRCLNTIVDAGLAEAADKVISRSGMSMPTTAPTFLSALASGMLLTVICEAR